MGNQIQARLCKIFLLASVCLSTLCACIGRQEDAQYPGLDPEEICSGKHLPEKFANAAEWTEVPAVPMIVDRTQPGHALLAINPGAAPYTPIAPAACTKPRQRFHIIVDICVSAEGSVTNVVLKQPSIPVIDVQVPVAIRRWRFYPYLQRGEPTPFCYSLRFTAVTGRR